MNKYIERGEKFLKNCVFNGLAHSWNVESKTYVKPYPEVTGDRKSTRLNSSHRSQSRMPSSA